MNHRNGGDSTSNGASTSTTGDARKERFQSNLEGNRYLELKGRRPDERREAIKRGQILDPEKRVKLEDAVDFVGSCMDMCPEFEREQREYQRSVDPLEVNLETGRIDPRRAVKTFHRPAAGDDAPLPSDVRPPHILKSTLDYLFHSILPHHPLSQVHPFLRDRTRSIRQDFTLQNERGELAIECHERIARFHILALHELRGMKDFAEHLELEQLRKTLQSLVEFYDDARGTTIRAPNEPEFRAYHLLSHIRDAGAARRLERLPATVLSHPFIKLALFLRSTAQTSTHEESKRALNSEASPNFFSRFFSIIARKETPFLIAALLEIHFNDIRKSAFKAMRKSFRSIHRAFPIWDLAEMLGANDVEEMVGIASEFGLLVERVDGVPVSVKLSKEVPFIESGKFASKSTRLIEPKRNNLSLDQIVDSAYPPDFIPGEVPPLNRPPASDMHSPPTPTSPVTTRAQRPNLVAPSFSLEPPASAPPAPQTTVQSPLFPLPKRPSIFAPQTQARTSAFPPSTSFSSAFPSAFPQSTSTATPTPTFGQSSSVSAFGQSTSAFNFSSPSDWISTPSLMPPNTTPSLPPAFSTPFATPKKPEAPPTSTSTPTAFSSFKPPSFTITPPESESSRTSAFKIPDSGSPFKSPPRKSDSRPFPIISPGPSIAVPLVPPPPQSSTSSTSPIKTVPPSPTREELEASARAARQSLVNTLASQTYERMVSSLFMTEAASTVASIQISRNTKRRYLTKWRNALVRRLQETLAEEELVRENRRKIREAGERLHGRNLSGSPDRSAGMMSRESTPGARRVRLGVGDVVSEVERHTTEIVRRDRLWAKGTFLDLIRQRIKSLSPNSTVPNNWFVWLCTALDEEASSTKWLRRKLDMEDSTRVGVPDIQGAFVRGIGEGADPIQSVSPPNVLLFEVSHDIVQGSLDENQRDRIWSWELHRLTSTLRAFPTPCNYLPTLIILAWVGSGRILNEVEADLMKRVKQSFHSEGLDKWFESYSVFTLPQNVDHESRFTETLKEAKFDFEGKLHPRLQIQDCIALYADVWKQGLQRGLQIAQKDGTVNWEVYAQLALLLFVALNDMLERVCKDSVPSQMFAPPLSFLSFDPADAGDDEEDVVQFFKRYLSQSIFAKYPSLQFTKERLDHTGSRSDFLLSDFLLSLASDVAAEMSFAYDAFLSKSTRDLKETSPLSLAQFSSTLEKDLLLLEKSAALLPPSKRKRTSNEHDPTSPKKAKSSLPPESASAPSTPKSLMTPAKLRQHLDSVMSRIGLDKSPSVSTSRAPSVNTDARSPSPIRTNGSKNMANGILPSQPGRR